MIRRTFLLLPIALPLRADERAEILEWLGKFAGFLTEENADSFLRACGKMLRERLDANVRALVLNNEISSSIAVLSVTENGDRRDVDLDWFLQLQSRALSTSTVRRRERLKLTIERAKKGWTVLEMSAVSLFDPPAV